MGGWEGKKEARQGEYMPGGRKEQIVWRREYRGKLSCPASPHSNWQHKTEPLLREEGRVRTEWGEGEWQIKVGWLVGRKE